MDKFVITGGNPLKGEVRLSGAKNVALKVLIAALLTDDELIIHNVPILSDVLSLLEVLKSLGVQYTLEGHTLHIQNGHLSQTTVPLDVGARLRTSSMVLGPLLSRYHGAKIPNPGGCRLGARPIDRHIDGLKAMGATITYHSDDGYFYATADNLHGAVIDFPKNTHTGTETLLLAAVLAEGTTVLNNAAEEIEVDELIELLNLMGAQIKRTAPRQITIVGVNKLKGAEYRIKTDRNEEVTFALAAAVTRGEVLVRDSRRNTLGAFLRKFSLAGGEYEAIDDSTTRYAMKQAPRPVDIETSVYPGFMTDWQAPWAVLMTQASGTSTIHETVFESRFYYVEELKKMGAKIEFFEPTVSEPASYYNFNWEDHVEGFHQAIRISGPANLHNAVVEIKDLRAGATMILAALVATGESYVHGAEHVDRGYEDIEARLQVLGANVRRIKEETI